MVKYKGWLDNLGNLNGFTAATKEALLGDEYTAPFVKPQQRVGAWSEIFNVVEYDDAAAREVFNKLKRQDGRVHWAEI